MFKNHTHGFGFASRFKDPSTNYWERIANILSRLSSELMKSEMAYTDADMMAVRNISSKQLAGFLHAPVSVLLEISPSSIVSYL